MRKVYLESLGCAANRVDTERVREMCRAAGLESTLEPREADLLVAMTCGFTQYQEKVSLQRICELQALKRDSAELVVGGCLPAINGRAVARAHGGFTFGPRTLDLFWRRLSSNAGADRLVSTVTACNQEPGVALIRVATGCLDRCTYCAIPFANGRIRSRSPEEIEGDIRAGCDVGYRVFHLVGEDIGAWGREQGKELVGLLHHLFNLSLPVRYRIHNLNPNWIRDAQDPLLQLLRSAKIVKKFYIPVQSGSDSILRRMRRRYTANEVRAVFRTFRTQVPEAKFSSDWIVGFPGETEEDFKQTRRLLVDLDLDFASIYKYESRPMVEAESLNARVSDEVKELRARTLIEDALGVVVKKRGCATIEQLVASLAPSETLPITTNVGMTAGEFAREEVAR